MAGGHCGSLTVFVTALLFIGKIQHLHTFYLCFLPKNSIPCALPTFDMGLIISYWLAGALLRYGYCSFVSYVCFIYFLLTYLLSIHFFMEFLLYKSFTFVSTHYTFKYTVALLFMKCDLYYCFVQIISFIVT